MSSEKKIVLNDEINEKDIEKENLSSDQIDAVAGGGNVSLRSSVDMESVPLRSSVDMESVPLRSSADLEDK